MIREMIVTNDGSPSISVPEMRVTYHSIHGAITESKHVFIEAGLKPGLLTNTNDQLNIFEMGFGTGLNAFLTLLVAENEKRSIYYETIDTNPLDLEEYESLQYPDLLSKEHATTFRSIHSAAWDQEHRVTPYFILNKKKTSLLAFATNKKFDLVYFDAFAPSAQPELWTKEVFDQVYSTTNPGGILVTYCAKGDVRRAMIAAGFHVEKLKGAPGKREMLRAIA